MRSSNLSSIHYASTWVVPQVENFNDHETINALGLKYAATEDGVEKETYLLEIIKAFDPYLRKYMTMIIRGQLPPAKSPAGREANLFLRTLAPSGSSDERLAMSNTCRTLHLAFKQATTDDIYDTLALCLMRAIKKYDPFYTEKVKRVCDEIISKCKGKPIRKGVKPEFTAAEITKRAGIESTGRLRLLVRRGHLASITDSKKKVIGYRRKVRSWPPPAKFFQSGPVGFTYFIPMYFRYYLHEYISDEMSAIESKEGMLQLDHRTSTDPNWGSVGDPGIPHADGAFTDSDGTSWAADVSLLNHILDISRMTIDWVNKTNDKLFRNMTKRERYILYLLFVKECKWAEIGTILKSDPQSIRKHYDEIIVYLRGHSAPKSIKLSPQTKI